MEETSKATPLCGPHSPEKVRMIQSRGSWVCPRAADHRTFLVSYTLEGEAEVEGVSEGSAEEGVFQAYSVDELSRNGEWHVSAEVSPDRKQRVAARPLLRPPASRPGKRLSSSASTSLV